MRRKTSLACQVKYMNFSYLQLWLNLKTIIVTLETFLSRINLKVGSREKGIGTAALSSCSKCREKGKEPIAKQMAYC